MVLSDDVSDDESTDDETESDGDYVEPREGDAESAEDAAWCDYCCNDVDATDSCLFGKDKTKWGKVKSSTHVWMAKYSDKITRGNWPSKVHRYALRNGTVSLEMKF